LVQNAYNHSFLEKIDALSGALSTTLFPAPVFKFHNNYRDMLLLIAAIGLSVLTTNVSINLVDAKSHGRGYGGSGYGGSGYGGPVIQEPVTTGNSHLDKAINKFYNCISKTHEDPPTIEKVDNCYYNTVGK
jgi:hypothetical protein